jgi:hypothetical protein
MKLMTLLLVNIMLLVKWNLNSKIHRTMNNFIVTLEVKFYYYPYSILLIDILSDLYIELYDSNELINDLDENPSNHFNYQINKIEFDFVFNKY